MKRASDRRSAWKERGLAALRSVDWPAVAICVLPLAAMAVAAQFSTERHARGIRSAPLTELVVPQVAPPAPWNGDLALEAMPVMPDAAGRVSVANVEPFPAPWHGDLALEAMPVMPNAAGRVSVANVEPFPAPWHGDLALEAMPLMSDGAGRVAIASVESSPAPWRGDLALEAMPVVPDIRTRLAKPQVTGRADVAAVPAPICLPAHSGALTAAARGVPDSAPRDPVAFGYALAAAAQAQLDEFVIYNPRYVPLAYPHGDTRPLYGVCTDVVVRAYRVFGVDFQELIYTSRLGRGDPSIDHRRVEVLRRFLERYGTSFEVSEFPEDFLPGDIVTYQRPQGRVSQHHVAIVSDQLAPSGRPMIVHNRGWGPQLEDALFADRITGHFRFSPADAEAFARSRRPQATRRSPDAVSLANEPN